MYVGCLEVVKVGLSDSRYVVLDINQEVEGKRTVAATQCFA